MSRTSRERYAALRQSAWRHPKLRGVSKGARLLFVMALSYASDFETDGRIPMGAVALIDGTKREAMELVKAGLWVSESGDYVVKSFLDHNASHAEMSGIRESRRAAGAKGGRGTSLAKAAAKAAANATANATAVAEPPLEHCASKTLPESESESESESDDEEKGRRGSDPEQATQPRSLPSAIAEQLTLPPNGRVIWRLLGMLSELHCYPDGRPIAIPGVMPSGNALTALDTLGAKAAPIAAAAQVPVLEYVALEWLALLALIADGVCDPKGPIVAYFVSRFPRLEIDRSEAASPRIPARLGEVAS